MKDQWRMKVLQSLPLLPFEFAILASAVMGRNQQRELQNNTFSKESHSGETILDMKDWDDFHSHTIYTCGGIASILGNPSNSKQ